MELMLTTPGTRLGIKNGKLEVSREGDVLGKHPANTIKSLICLPGVHPNESVISQISRNGGKLVFLSSAGRLKSMLVTVGDAGNVQTRMHQFSGFANREMCLRLSKSIAKSKIHNMDRFSREFSDEIHVDLRNLKNTISGIDDISTLRGVEGLAAKMYFSELRKRIPEKHRANMRIKRFAPDAMNQAQSFVYSMLHHTMIGLIHGAGLDPFLGFYHQPSYNHAALASDLMEPYRAQVCDRIIVKTFKNGEFLKALAENDTPEKGLGQMGLTILRKAYIERLEEKVLVDGEERSFLRLMHHDVFDLRRLLDGEEDEFQPWLSA
ncbi:MAG: CRISPR-associated endonuclease Cas1 [Candidatus Marinimicrobia bacterium]|nr:CRISPR-associated endonuclease Cas1 [Candidatus Neomarinimicrobiota bacterium]